MKLTDAYRIIKEAIKSHTTVMLWGPPGVGKSSLIHQVGAELYSSVLNADQNSVLDLRLAQLEPTDLRGVPMPNHDTGRADWYLPAFWPARALKATERVLETTDGKPTTIPVKAGECLTGPGILFLDEIEKAPISVKNASLQLVLDRKIGAYKLPDDWAIVCAGNNEDDNCFSGPLGAALANRMLHVPVEPDVDAFAAWARDSGNVCEDIIGFLYLRPDMLYKQTEEHAFPSPRSWAMASNMIKAVSNQREQAELLSASVGKVAKQEFVIWQNVYRNVDPEAILNGTMPERSKFEEPTNQSLRYAITLAVAFHLKKRKNGVKGIEVHLAKFLKYLSPELRTLLLKQLTLRHLEAMAAAPAFSEFMRDMYKIVT